MANEVRIRASIKDDVSGPLDRIKDRITTLGKTGAAKSILQGVGMGMGISAFNLFSTAVGTATDFLKDSVAAAIEDERSIAKLTASLRANVPAWNGQTDAIERLMKSREMLGFSDDEQRDSLARLVVATKNVNQGLNVQRTAMDLARLKGISLAEASDALIKVEAGQFRVLKALGIELKKGATQTEALAAVQKAATGQAEAYANTVEGKALVAQVKFNEAQERFGRAIMPVVSEALDVLTRALDNSIISYQDTTDAAAHGSQAAEAHGRAMRATAWAARDAADRQAWLADKVEMAGGAMSTGADAADDLGDSLYDVKKAAEKADDAIKDLTDTIIDELYGDVVDAGERAELVDQLVDYGKELRTAKRRVEELAEIKHPTKAQQRDLQDAQREVTILQGKIGGLKGDLLKLDYQIAASKGPEELKKWFDRTTKSVDKTDDETLTLIADLKRLATVAGKLGNVDISVRGGPFQRGKAIGGPVNAGEPYVVGEKGPEVFVPGASGNIIPNSKLRAPTRQGGSPSGMVGSLTVNIYPNGLMTPAMARQFGDTAGPAIYDYLYRRGAVGRAA